MKLIAMCTKKEQTWSLETTITLESRPYKFKGAEPYAACATIEVGKLTPAEAEAFVVGGFYEFTLSLSPTRVAASVEKYEPTGL